MTASNRTGPAAAPGARPRLLVVASTYPAHPGDGTPGFVRDLALVESRSFETMVVVPRVPGGAAREDDATLRVRRFAYFPRRWEDLAHGAIIENLRAKRSRLLQVVPFIVAEALAVRRAVRDFRPDVVHVHWIVPQGVAALLGARRVPWLVTTLGGDLYALQDPLSTRLKRAVLRRAGAATAMNADMVERMTALGAPRSATIVLPMGADVAAVRQHAAGVTRVPGRILFVGRLVEKKGVHVLLDALAELPPGLEWSLDIVGGGPMRAELERSAARYGERVRFLGQLGRGDLARAYAACEVIVVPSVPARSGDQDGLPVALLEAMSVGCAVVASRLPGIDEAVGDGESGVLVPPGDRHALAEAIAGLLADHERRDRFGAQAKARSEQYSSEAIGQRYVDLLRRVAEREIGT